jgi:hypothetical protein
MTSLTKEVQQKILDLKIGEYLRKETLEMFFSTLGVILDREYANELIGEIEKNVEEYANILEKRMKKLQEIIDSEYQTATEESMKIFANSSKNLDKFKPYFERKIQEGTISKSSKIQTNGMSKNSTEKIKKEHQDGYSLQYASLELHNNKEVVLEAVKQDGYSLQYASLELQNDKDLTFQFQK